MKKNSAASSRLFSGPMFLIAAIYLLFFVSLAAYYIFEIINGHFDFLSLLWLVIRNHLGIFIVAIAGAIAFLRSKDKNLNVFARFGGLFFILMSIECFFQESTLSNLFGAIFRGDLEYVWMYLIGRSFLFNLISFGLSICLFLIGLFLLFTPLRKKMKHHSGILFTVLFATQAFFSFAYFVYTIVSNLGMFEPHSWVYYLEYLLGKFSITLPLGFFAMAIFILVDYLIKKPGNGISRLWFIPGLLQAIVSVLIALSMLACYVYFITVEFEISTLLIGTCDISLTLLLNVTTTVALLIFGYWYSGFRNSFKEAPVSVTVASSPADDSLAAPGPVSVGEAKVLTDSGFPTEPEASAEPDPVGETDNPDGSDSVEANEEIE